MDALFSDYEDVRKSGLFDAEYYLAAYPDVADRNLDPLVHYLEEGAAEGRNPHADFDAAFYLEQCRERGEGPQNPLLHYIRIGAARGFKTRADDAGDTLRPRQPANAGAGLGKAPILVAIESLGVVGASDGTSRFSVGGWALAASPIAEITVSLDGEVAGTATYGLARPDVARLYPDRPGAAQCGFILAFTLPSLKSGTIEPLLTVRLEDGEVGHRPLSVEIPPQQVGAPVIDPFGNAPDAPETATAAMQLHIDEAIVDAAGILRLSGWVVCLVQIEAVEVIVDGEVIGKAEFGRARDDVEKAHAEYPNARFSGYKMVTDLSRFGAGRKTVRVRATARTGIERDTSTRVEVPDILAPAGPAEHRFQYHCDEITLSSTGRLVLKGWVLPAVPAEAVRVFLDEEEIGRAELGLERPDVGNLFPSLPHARAPGFGFEGSTARPIENEHIITLLVDREDGQTDEVVIPVIPVVEREPPTEYSSDPELKLHIDSPRLIDGAVEAPIRGNLEISGWALARAGVAAIEIAVDGRLIAIADYGLRRLDIRAAFPDWENSLAAGYQVMLPHRVLPKGGHTVSVRLRDNGGRAASAEFRIDVEELSDIAGPWALRRKMAQAEIDLSRRLIEHRGGPPLFIVLLPLSGSPGELEQARVTVASLASQAHPHWRLLVITDTKLGKRAALRERLLAGLAVPADRVEIIATAAPRELIAHTATAGESLFTVLTPGDELGCDALLEMAVAAAMDPEADFLYSDERCRNPASGQVEAFFKPQWSPDLMLSSNYIGRLWCARTGLLKRIGDGGNGLLDHGEYELVLRCTEAAKAISHIPAVLCERAGDTAGDPRQDQQAVERALVRRGIDAEVRPGLTPRSYRIKRTLTKPGLVSIVIPTCAAQGLIKTCLDSLRRITAYQNYEIVCIENIPPKDRKWRTWLRRNADRVVSTTEPYNWARFNNLAMAEATGEYVLFLNDDIEILDPDWLDVLVEHAQRPEIGVVGARLLYPDRRLQHAGLFLAALGQGRHAFRYLAEDDPGYFGLALTERNVIAVTGACLFTRRDTYDMLGGFDETQAVINNDMDFCLRAWKKGLLTVYTPHVRMIHKEAISRAALDDTYDAAVFDSKWRDVFLAGDPFFNPNLSKHYDDFQVDHEPSQLIVTGGPALRRDDVRRILLIKLDHIGDCIISFPAVRRLRQLFPHAHIAVLTSRSSRPVWSMEPSVDETIEFDFFHARSGLGELTRSDEDWEQLRQRLSPERFDLAIDMRKHIETRPVLQYTGARYLAGFDWRNQFPWLDIALEWTGDQMFARKHQHNGDDLINLVDAVAAACDSDRQLIARRPAPSAPPAILKPNGSAAAPLVCVHAGAGNDMKQWPVEYFAAVIDRLIEVDGARIVMIGSRDDAAATEAVMQRVQHQKSVASLVGELPLTELPALLAGASLFLGNDSGPKHIAAGLGVPTVGVHAGTVDVREWGPIGPSAIAVAREVICAPCYLAKVQDCRRGLVCLRQLEPAKVYAACKRLLLLADAPPAMRHTGNGDARASDVAAVKPPRRRARTAKRPAAPPLPAAGI